MCGALYCVGIVVGRFTLFEIQITLNGSNTDIIRCNKCNCEGWLDIILFHSCNLFNDLTLNIIFNAILQDEELAVFYLLYHFAF